MDQEKRGRLFQVFQPDKPLDANDAALYVERAESVVEEFCQQMELPGEHRFVLVGAVGSGRGL